MAFRTFHLWQSSKSQKSPHLQQTYHDWSLNLQMKLTNSLKSRHSYSLGLSTAWSPFSSWLVGFSLCSMVLQRQEIYFISWSKCLSLQLEEQLLLSVLWAWDEAAKQKSLIRTLQALSSIKITVRKGRHCLSKMVNCQGPEPPSFTSRGLGRLLHP